MEFEKLHLLKVFEHSESQAKEKRHTESQSTLIHTQSLSTLP